MPSAQLEHDCEHGGVHFSEPFAMLLRPADPRWRVDDGLPEGIPEEGEADIGSLTGSKFRSADRRGSAPAGLSSQAEGDILSHGSAPGGSLSGTASLDSVGEAGLSVASAAAAFANRSTTPGASASASGILHHMKLLNLSVFHACRSIRIGKAIYLAKITVMSLVRPLTI